MIVVLADDFSGAAEIAGIASRYFDEVELATRFPDASSAKLVVVDSDTRLRTDEEAAKKIQELCHEIRAAGVSSVFKKIDSVLRGPVGAEINAALLALGRKRAVLASANPSRQRIVRSGRYFCDGVPLHESEFAEDPVHPVTTSVVKELAGDLPSVSTPDVESRRCLESIRNRLQDDELPVGAADFFSVWISRHVEARKSDPCHGKVDPGSGNHLWACGSLTSWRQREADFAKHGVPCAVAPAAVFEGEDGSEKWTRVVFDCFANSRCVAMALGSLHPVSPVDPASLLSSIAGTVHRVSAAIGIERLFLEGGATARAVVDRFKETRWTIEREWAPGVVEIKCVDAATGSPRHVVVKPGSYQWPERIWPEVQEHFSGQRIRGDNAR